MFTGLGDVHSSTNSPLYFKRKRLTGVRIADVGNFKLTTQCVKVRRMFNVPWRSTKMLRILDAGVSFKVYGFWS